jgi:UDP-N-acetyl-D-mannosaminuronic acid dehydrogenase
MLALPDAETAEFSKLLETTYRDVNIALANEFAMIGDHLGVDTRAAISAANSQPYSHVHTPGPGVGGHCIPVYPYFLAAPQMPLEAPAESSALAAATRRINDAMAGYAAERLASALGSLQGATVVVLGLAYRPGVKETRHSSAFDLVRELQRLGARVYVHDPFFSETEIAAFGVTPAPAWPLSCDALVVHAWHKEYQSLDFTSFPGLRAVLDARGSIDPASVTGLGVTYVGIGVATA